MYARTRSFCRALAGSLALAWTLAALPHAAADNSAAAWLRVDRVEAQPSLFEGHARLRVYVSAVNLQGAVIEDIRGDKAWTLRLGSSKPRLPYIAGTFETIGDELALAIVVQSSPDFADVLPAIKEELTGFLDALPRKETQVAIIHYDDTVHGNRAVVPISRATKMIEELAPATDPGPKELLQAVEQARRAVDKAKPSQPGTPMRRVVVVIGDGRDVDYPNPENYRKISSRADREGIRIHTIAFAPDGNRLPLRGMAELSKRSHGTFRFAYSKSGFRSHFAELRKELVGQYVLTYFVPTEELEAKRIEIMARDLESGGNARISKVVCGEAPCASPSDFCVAGQCVVRNRDTGRGVLGWILIIGGIVLGALVTLVVVALVLGRVLERRRLAANEAGLAPPGASTPGSMPDAAPQPGGVIQPVQPVGAGNVIQPVRPASGPHAAYPPSSQHPAVPPSGSHAAYPPSGQHQAAMGSGSYPRAATGGVIQPVGMGGQPVMRTPPSLLVIKGPLQGHRVPLHHGFVIGKAPNCHLVLAGDNYASQHHAQILMDKAGGCTLIDQGSTNGTFINGVRTSEQRLAHGMLITIGSTEARFLAQ